MTSSTYAIYQENLVSSFRRPMNQLASEAHNYVVSWCYILFLFANCTTVLAQASDTCTYLCTACEFRLMAKIVAPQKRNCDIGEDPLYKCRGVNSMIANSPMSQLLNKLLPCGCDDVLVDVQVVSHEQRPLQGKGIMDQVSCLGNETSIWHCRAMRSLSITCHNKVFVICSGEKNGL